MKLALLALALLLTIRPDAVRADDNRPLSVQIVANQDGTVQLRWKLPPNLDSSMAPALRPPQSCTSGPTRSWSDQLGHWSESRWHCNAGLAGNSIQIQYPAAAPPLATIARLEQAGSQTQTLLLQPGQDQLLIPAPATSRGVFTDFLRLGIAHIWRGTDHLLFVAGLIFIAGTTRRVLATITGFTIAHSITLVLSALNLVRLPSRAIESVIALSIILLAVEIVKGPRDTLTWRRPITIAASFGLLHGFGFAAVLREVGLPQDGLLTALFSFNLGIELGQVLFAAPVMLAIALARHAMTHQSMPASMRAQKTAGYCVGVLASYWMFTRLLA